MKPFFVNGYQDCSPHRCFKNDTKKLLAACTQNAGILLVALIHRLLVKEGNNCELSTMKHTLTCFNFHVHRLL